MSDWPANSVAAQLAGAVTLPTPPGGAVALALGSNLFVGPERAVSETVPRLAVFVLQSGGAPPQPYLGTGISWTETRVQVLVRSGVDDFAGGEALARALWELLHVLAPTGYVSCLANEADPVYLGFIDSEHHRWSMNFTLGRDR